MECGSMRCLSTPIGLRAAKVSCFGISEMPEDHQPVIGNQLHNAPHTKNRRPRKGVCFQLVKKSLAEFAALAANKIQFILWRGAPQGGLSCPLGQFTFCTRHKILYRTQVCSLSALSGQRASPKGISFGHAQCPAGDFVEKPNRFFDSLKTDAHGDMYPQYWTASIGGTAI